MVNPARRSFVPLAFGDERQNTGKAVLTVQGTVFL